MYKNSHHNKLEILLQSFLKRITAFCKHNIHNDIIHQKTIWIPDFLNKLPGTSFLGQRGIYLYILNVHDFFHNSKAPPP